MEPDKMLEELNEKEEKLRNELMELEQMFNVKKEQYLKMHQINSLFVLPLVRVYLQVFTLIKQGFGILIL